VKDLLDHLLVGDLVTDGPELICVGGGAHGEILHALPRLELLVGEVPTELVCCHLLDAVATHVHCPERVTSVRGSLLARQVSLHLLRHCL
jgi:hypothetical protein